MLYLIEKLKNGEKITLNPRGNSMTPKIKSGQKIELSPIKETDDISKGNIVFCKVSGRIYIHLVTAVRGNQYQISNNHGHINGWTTRENIFGIVSHIF